MSREPKYVVSKARSFLGCLRLPGTSGVDLSLLLDGWFINDSLVVTFFALLPFEEPNRHCQNNGDPKNTGQGHGKDDTQTQSCVGKQSYLKGGEKIGS